MADRNNFMYVVDPIKFQRILWPSISFYNCEVDLIYSVVDNKETICVAGNKLGKDFSAAFIALWFFLTRRPCRVVTTSVDEMQLNGVLWGEIRNLIQTSRYPLDYRHGGPLVVNDLEIKKVFTNGPKKGTICGKSYLRGRVAKKGEGLLGHHLDEAEGIPHTLGIADEASGVDDVSWDAMESWAHRRLAIGNPYPCSNFFYRAVEGGTRPDGNREVGGDIDRPAGDPRPGKLRKILTITAEDSPNVRYARAQQAAGLEPTGLEDGRVLVPGVLTWYEFLERNTNWNDIRKSIGLLARFWKGSDLLMYPPQWLRKAEEWAKWLMDKGIRRKAEGMGVDPAEGGDSSSWTIVDRYGVIHQLSMKTPNTAVIPGTTLALMREFDLSPKQVAFDAGGGGKEHADALNDKGFEVRIVGFGDTIRDDPKRGATPLARKLGLRSEQVAYRDRRAQMYGTLRSLLDPSRLLAIAALGKMKGGRRGFESEGYDASEEVLEAIHSIATAAPEDNPELIGFAIGAQFHELHRQLEPIPLKYDEDGRLYMIPKDKPNPTYKGVTVKQLIGCSPDESDSLVLAIHAMLDRPARIPVGGFD